MNSIELAIARHNAIRSGLTNTYRVPAPTSPEVQFDPRNAPLIIEEIRGTFERWKCARQHRFTWARFDGETGEAICPDCLAEWLCAMRRVLARILSAALPTIANQLTQLAWGQAEQKRAEARLRFQRLRYSGSARDRRRIRRQRSNDLTHELRALAIWQMSHTEQLWHYGPRGRWNPAS